MREVNADTWLGTNNWIRFYINPYSVGSADALNHAVVWCMKQESPNRFFVRTANIYLDSKDDALLFMLVNPGFVLL